MLFMEEECVVYVRMNCLLKFYILALRVIFWAFLMKNTPLTGLLVKVILMLNGNIKPPRFRVRESGAAGKINPPVRLAG